MKNQILTAFIVLLASSSVFAQKFVMGEIERKDELIIVSGSITCSAHALDAVKPDATQIVHADTNFI